MSLRRRCTRRSGIKIDAAGLQSPWSPPLGFRWPGVLVIL
jgi:hypothetical protein